MAISGNALRSVFLVLALMASPAHACMDAVVPSFRQALSSATSVAIVRIESISLLPQPHKDLVLRPDMVARLQVADVVLGPKPKVELLRFTGTWCGGHNLKVGEHYVLLVDRDARILDLDPGSQSMVYLFGEYDEREGASRSDSVFLMHLRNFARLGAFPDDFPVEKFLEHNAVRRDVAPQP